MKIVYIITLLILFTLFILVKKTNKKENILFWSMITCAILLPYNVILTYFLTIIGIKSSLIALVILNIIISIVLGLKLFKDKEKQQYYIKIKDGIAIVLLFLLVVLVAYNQYGLQFNIKYETTDPGVHFKAAKDFYEQKVLLYKGEQTSYYEYETFMPLAYVNTGLLFEIFSNTTVDMHKLYIVFDLAVLFLMGVIFYFALSNNTNMKLGKLIATILSAIFILGYPLNSMLFGFAYLSVALLIIVAILSLTRYIKEKDISITIISITFFLLMFGLFFSYYLFVPVIYVALGLYILFDIIKNRKEVKLFSKNNIIKVILILVLPTILGFIYFILPGMLSGSGTSVSHIATEGYIYRDLYINFIPFAPFILHYIFNTLKNKRNKFSVIATIILLGYIALTFVGGMIGKVSSYYYFKSYFVLWIFAIYLTYKSFEILAENDNTKMFVFSYVFIYVVMTLFVYFGIDSKITNRNILFNPSARSTTLLDVQTINTVFVNNENVILNQEQIEAIRFLNSKIDKKDNAIVYGDMLERIWTYVLTGITDSTDLNSLYECPIKTIDEFINSDKKYMIYYINNSNTEQLQLEDTNEYEIVFYNGFSAVLEKNN